MSAYQLRIVGRGEVDPRSIEPHPRNARLHPKRQQDAVRGSIEDLGYVDQVIVNRRTNRIVNGHLRTKLAIEQGATSIPVIWVDLDDDAELLAVTLFDRMKARAEEKPDTIRALIEQQQATMPSQLAQMGAEWVRDFAAVIQVAAPAAPAPSAEPDEAADDEDEDAGEETSPAASTPAAPAKPTLIRVSVGRYQTDIPEERYRAWLKEFIGAVGSLDDLAAIERELFRRLKLT